MGRHLRALSLALLAGLAQPCAHAKDKYGIGDGDTLVYLKPTLSVAFSDTFGPDRSSACLLTYDAISNGPRGYMRTSGSFGRSAAHPDAAGIMTAYLTMVSSGNNRLTPVRPWAIYVQSSTFTSGELVKSRSELGENGVLLQFTNKPILDHLFYQMLEEKAAKLIIIKDDQGEELALPLDLTVADSTKYGDQVRNSEALDAFRRCMGLEREPPRPGQTRFFR